MKGEAKERVKSMDEGMEREKERESVFRRGARVN